MPVRDRLLREFLAAIEKKEQQQLIELVEDNQPYDIAQILLIINAAQRKELFQHLPNWLLADLIQELDHEDQQLIISEISAKKTAQILTEMSSDDAADLVGELDDEKRQELLALLDDEEAIELRELLQYPENSAGGLMTTEFVVIPKAYTACEAIDKLRELAPDAETVYYLYVVDEEEKLIGVLSLRDLIVAGPETIIAEIMYERVVSVPTDMDQEEVARVMEKYDFLAVPVVDMSMKLVGIVTIDDAMDVIKDEVSEDIAKFGGIGGKEAGVQDLNIGAFDAAKKRIPWLALLLLIGIMSGNIIAQFEETLDQVIILAVFIPMIADMAGNTGTQSLAVVVRGLATGEFIGKDALRLIKREAGVGVIIGTVNGLLISVLVALWQQNIWLGFVIGFSLWVTLFFATLAGTIVPLLMDRLKIDPAIASGPFITTINDILGLTIYFTVATRFMEYLI
ncbi:MAG: magnesium transporter [Clostridia bacterium]|jgi:magnesium transporter|nr:magnesium transporter [Clostridia bacterium]